MSASMAPPPPLRDARRAHRVSVVAGVVVLGLAVASIWLGPREGCGGLSRGYAPIIAFELARSEADLEAIFGGAPGACRDTMIEAMDRATVADYAVFIPAYGAFLIAAFIGLGRRGRSGTAVGAWLAALAVVADGIENLCLLELTPALDADSPWLTMLPWAAGVKWLALGAVGAVAGLALWPGGRGAKLGAVACTIAPIMTVAAIAAPHQVGPVVSAGVAASWLALLVDGAVHARAA